jgi:hypothetical protein
MEKKNHCVSNFRVNFCSGADRENEALFCARREPRHSSRNFLRYNQAVLDVLTRGVLVARRN